MKGPLNTFKIRARNTLVSRFISNQLLVIAQLKNDDNHKRKRVRFIHKMNSKNS